VEVVKLANPPGLSLVASTFKAGAVGPWELHAKTEAWAGAFPGCTNGPGFVRLLTSGLGQLLALEPGQQITICDSCLPCLQLYVLSASANVHVT
jgi:hypothetical protein